MGELLAGVRRRTRWLNAWFGPIAGVGLGMLAYVAIFRMQTSTADFDPQYMRVVVERTIRFGGGYYENAVHNKGPLEPAVYEVARRIGGDAGFWLMVAIATLLAALVVGGAAAVAARRFDAPPVATVSTAAAVVALFTLSDSDYAGVLYARNISTALLAGAFAVGVSERCWATGRRRRWAIVAVAAAIGLAVQTVLTAAFTAAPILLWVMWRRRSWRVALGAALAFVSAPLYYLLGALFGVRSFTEFWLGWITYARQMSTATGRGLGGQFELGIEQFWNFYGDRWVLVAAVAAWAIATAARWRHLSPSQRSLAALAALWTFGAWVELALSQRYSSHYFSVLAVPTAIMVGQLVGLVTRPLWRIFATPAARLLPLVAAAVVTMLTGATPFGEGIERAATTNSFADLERREDAGRGPRIHVERAVLDLFSEAQDPLLAWTPYPWVYLDRDRVSATRYPWKTFLLGEVYLAGRSEEYVLPGTWEHFAADLAAADPIGLLVEEAVPIEEGTPFDDAVAGFTPALVTPEGTLGLRRDLAGWLFGGPDDEVPATGAVANDDGSLGIDLGCGRIDVALPVDGDTRFEIAGGTDEPAALAVLADDRGVVVESRHHGRSTYRHAEPLEAATVSATLVMGDRSTVLVLDGTIVGAVSRRGALRVEGAAVPTFADHEFTLAPAHPLSDCDEQ